MTMSWTNFISERMLKANRFSKNVFVCVNGERALNFVSGFMNSSERGQRPFP
jgi:hypothetical protein